MKFIVNYDISYNHAGDVTVEAQDSEQAKQIVEAMIHDGHEDIGGPDIVYFDIEVE